MCSVDTLGFCIFWSKRAVPASCKRAFDRIDTHNKSFSIEAQIDSAMSNNFTSQLIWFYLNFKLKKTGSADLYDSDRLNWSTKP